MIDDESRLRGTERIRTSTPLVGARLVYTRDGTNVRHRPHLGMGPRPGGPPPVATEHSGGVIRGEPGRTRVSRNAVSFTSATWAELASFPPFFREQTLMSV